jgi:hypothetical protein
MLLVDTIISTIITEQNIHSLHSHVLFIFFADHEFVFLVYFFLLFYNHRTHNMNSVIGSILIFALLALVFNVDHAIATRTTGGLRGLDLDSIDADSGKRRDLSDKSAKSEGSKKSGSMMSGSMKKSGSMKSGSMKSAKSAKSGGSMKSAKSGGSMKSAKSGGSMKSAKSGGSMKSGSMKSGSMKSTK